MRYPCSQRSRPLFLEFVGDIVGDQVEGQGEQKKDDPRGEEGMVMPAPEGRLAHLRGDAAGMGRTESKRLSGIAAAPPATMRTTIVSPIARAIPRMTAVEMPESADGMVTLTIVSDFVAPSA